MLVFLGTVTVVLASIALGYRAGQRRRNTAVDSSGPVGALVGAVLGLLAFVPAFTFGAAAGRFDSRKKLLLEVVAASRSDGQAPTTLLLMPALNDVFDLHTSRVTVALQYRIPQGIWNGLLLITVLAMVSVGYQLGLSNARSLLIPAMLAITVSTVVLLIADLDRATAGGLTVNQQPMLALEKEFSGLAQ